MEAKLPNTRTPENNYEQKDRLSKKVTKTTTQKQKLPKKTINNHTDTKKQLKQPQIQKQPQRDKKGNKQMQNQQIVAKMTKNRQKLQKKRNNNHKETKTGRQMG